MLTPYIPRMFKQGLYDPAWEHDACGVGLVANIKGVKSHSIVTQALKLLDNLEHRGGCGADPQTGDGAGIMVQMPHDFFAKKAQALSISLPESGQYGVGMVFLPHKLKDRQNAKEAVQRLVTEEGHTFLGWREVPIQVEAIGSLAATVMPYIAQFFVGKKSPEWDERRFELQLYILRRQIEKAVSHEDFYICSLSCNRVVYKGLVMACQVAGFYPDLEDEDFISCFGLVHSRFSTNTLGSWKLAHPYRMVIHNGEINTLRGNINWMAARQHLFQSQDLGEDLAKLLPIIPSSAQSDTASFDNALELLLATGRSLPHALMMMIPEAWGDHLPMDRKKRAFYEYHSCLMEPWDGPALIIATDGHQVCAILDRNGLRPCRYLVTTDDLLVMSSETGVLDIPVEKIRFKERIRPGRLFLLDTQEGRLVEDEEIKQRIASQKPYEEWLTQNQLKIEDLPDLPKSQHWDFSSLLPRQQAFGYTLEDLRVVLHPMASQGKEPIGSMGNDTPLAVMSDQCPLLFNYFKQLFAQVSNPPLDAIREELVTSLSATIGAEGNLFEETPTQARQLRLSKPIITNQDLDKIRHLDQEGFKSQTLSALFSPEGSLEESMEKLCQHASQAVAEGCTLLILSDRGVDADHVPIPSLLATAGVHHHLIREGTRTKVGLVVETGEAREVAHFALLIGYGAGAVNPYLALESIAHWVEEEKKNGEAKDFETLQAQYLIASGKGILKIMSKMGISTIQSYRGAQQFEALGLNESFILRYFTGTPSRIGGVGIEAIQKESLARHRLAYQLPHLKAELDLQPGGFYQWRRNGEYHMWNPDTIVKLQQAVRTGNWDTYRQFAEFANGLSEKLCTIRGLLEFKWADHPIPLEEVEEAKEIVKRFATGAISLGSISREAHETLAIAMNRLGARSNTGEGGEDYHRYMPDPNGDSRNSAIKQVASGRFGVTINYLAHARDLQIKMAQGSKPGEGGQIPGHKVDEYIGWIRNATPGVELISPPPHHDIYSIEDLAQLIFDLKNANPTCRVHVKLVSEVGVGTIAAGVAKGHADVVLISGDSGGTGASPESSIKHAGLPWELGLAETQQVLVLNNLRSRIVVQTDGQLKTGRDVAIACLLGAEEFGMATAPLITMGCIMLRKCHLNTCSVGIATQDPLLRSLFNGKPEHVIHYFFFVAEELRLIMAQMGFRTIDEMVGRVDRLDSRKAVAHWKGQGLDFSALLHQPEVPESVPRRFEASVGDVREGALDHLLIQEAQEALDHRHPVVLKHPIYNTNRAVGTTLSYEVAKRYGEEGLPDDTITIQLQGSTGQSFAAFLAKGVTMKVEGDANDYFGKGLSGGRVIITAPENASYTPETSVLVGNVCLYGATGGQAFIRGIAGERFAVRNSGAEAVVEGVGDHGCEYMTRGKVVILGPTGRNFAAGMSGGEAYVLDEAGKFADSCNLSMVGLEPIVDKEDVLALRRLIHDHYLHTGSLNAKKVLDNWESFLPRFVKVMPHEYKRVLAKRVKA